MSVCWPSFYLCCLAAFFFLAGQKKMMLFLLLYASRWLNSLVSSFMALSSSRCQLLNPLSVFPSFIALPSPSDHERSFVANHQRQQVLDLCRWLLIIFPASFAEDPVVSTQNAINTHTHTHKHTLKVTNVP